MMTKNAYAFVVIEEKVMAFKHAKDRGLIPIFESFAPLKEGFLKNFKERCNLEFLESLDLLFLYDKPSAHEIFSLCKELKNSIWDRKLVVALVEALEGFKDWNLSLKIEDKRSNSFGNGAKKLLTNADLESSHQKIVIDSMKTYHQSQQEKCKRNVELLEQALEIYSIQARASKELVEGAWESVKKILGFYTNKH
ncbi:hypothetical protein HpMS54_01030 [Helicobacter pylori]